MEPKIRVFKVKTEDGIRIINVDNEYDAKRLQHLNECYEMTGGELDIFGNQLNWAGSPYRTEVDGDDLETAVVTHNPFDNDEIFKRNEEKYKNGKQIKSFKGITVLSRIHLFCSVLDWPLMCLFLFSLLAVVILEFTEIRFQMSLGNAEKVNDFIRNISYSFLSATIFYFFCIAGKAYKELLHHHQQVAKKIFEMLDDCAQGIKQVGIEADIKYKGKFPSQEELKNILEQIDPNELSKRATIVGSQFVHISNFDAVFFIVSGVVQRSVEIIEYLYLFDKKDFKLLRLLEQIRETPSYKLMKGPRPQGSKWPYKNLSFYYPQHLKLFLKNIDKIRRHYENQYKPFLLKED